MTAREMIFSTALSWAGVVAAAGFVIAIAVLS